MYILTCTNRDLNRALGFQFRANKHAGIKRIYEQRFRCNLTGTSDHCQFIYGKQVQTLVIDKWAWFHRGEPYDKSPEVFELIDLGQDDDQAPPLPHVEGLLPVGDVQNQPANVPVINDNVPVPEVNVEVVEVDGVPADIEVLSHVADTVQIAIENVPNPPTVAQPVHHEYATPAIGNSLSPSQNVDNQLPSFPEIPRPPTPPLPTADVQDQVLQTPAHDVELVDNSYTPGASSSHAPTYKPTYEDISD